MALSQKNRKIVGGALIVGMLGGSALIGRAIVFTGDASKTTLEQIPKITPGLGGAIDAGGTLGAKGVDNLGKIQDSLSALDAKTTSTTAAAGAPAAPGPAGNPDS